MKITTLYFSATYTTKRVVEAVAKNLSNEVVAYDITNAKSTSVVSGSWSGKSCTTYEDIKREKLVFSLFYWRLFVTLTYEN